MLIRLAKIRPFGNKKFAIQTSSGPERLGTRRKIQCFDGNRINIKFTYILIIILQIKLKLANSGYFKVLSYNLESQTQNSLKI